MPGGATAPWSVVATWPKPNYVDPVHKGNALTVVSLLFGAITIVLVVLRMYARIFIIKKPGLDDILIILGLLFGIALTPLLIIGNNKYGIGIHKWDLEPSNAVNLRKITYWTELLFVWSISCTKISILLFYRRLAAGSATRAFLWGTWIGVAYNVAYFITYTIVQANMCHPVSAYWNQFNLFKYTTKFSCIDEGMVLPLGAALSVLSDLYGCLLPLLLLRHLQMAVKQKILLYALFALGFVVVGSGIVRVYYLVYILHYTYDVTWDLWDMFIWLILEVYVAIICASAPALKPLYTSWIAHPVTNPYSSYYLHRSKAKSSQLSSSSPSSTGVRSYFAKKAFDAGKGNEMNIMVRSDIEMSRVERRDSGASDELVLPKHGFVDDFGEPGKRGSPRGGRYVYAV